MPRPSSLRPGARRPLAPVLNMQRPAVAQPRPAMPGQPLMQQAQSFVPTAQPTPAAAAATAVPFPPRRLSPDELLLGLHQRLDARLDVLTQKVDLVLALLTEPVESETTESEPVEDPAVAVEAPAQAVEASAAAVEEAQVAPKASDVTAPNAETSPAAE